MKRSLTVILGCLFSLVNCTSLSKRGPSGPAPKQVTILFKGKAGESTRTAYHSDSRTQTFTDNQITHDRQEIVDFMVDTHVTAVDAKTISADVKTVRKDGTVDLHDLAFPELGEEIGFILRPDGEVLKAGKYSPHSIYFVPSLPVPGHAVEVGDTWTMEHSWVSSRDEIPLTLGVVGILKAVVPCEKSYCADIEISGSVKLGTGPLAQGARFDSRVWGRVLFSLERGDVIWSEMRSSEEMTSPIDRTKVSSCMVSEMQIPTAAKKLDCEPGEHPVENTPEL